MMGVTVMGIKEFMLRIREDTDFAEMFKGMETPEEVVALAKREGYDFTVEDIKNNTELTDEELDMASGAGFVIVVW